MSDILLISGSLRAKSSNSALLRTAATLTPDGFRGVPYVTNAANAHASLRLVLDYTDAAIVDAACAHLPVTPAMIDENGFITDGVVREGICTSLVALCHRVRFAS
ncbi:MULTISPECIES: hypothetical protein [unclassified Rhodococcus (in: high G+C Gram-positive bacteria)]|uniref:hypothetical protein n=1 Tax=unclassified Rhodococcus (in: high G+C Gram-positive bacteria) TaxID=192944 RepID=UPI001B34A7BF|nr:MULTISPECIES: hypothetical protein [unclassified Rhodococcus (in: high G+C Gram-positive bacteria)]